MPGLCNTAPHRQGKGPDILADAANTNRQARAPRPGRLRIIAPFVVLLIVGAVAAASMLAIAARSLNDGALSTETALAV